MQTKTAKLFFDGESQAVRLPAEFRFERSEEVYVRRDSVTGDVILSATPPRSTWADFFALRDQAGVPQDFMAERPLNAPLCSRDILEQAPSPEGRVKLGSLLAANAREAGGLTDEEHAMFFSAHTQT